MFFEVHIVMGVDYSVEGKQQGRCLRKEEPEVSVSKEHVQQIG